MARRHIKARHFTSVSRCNARLLQLVNANLLVRSYPSGAERVGEAVYSLGPASNPIVAAALDLDIATVRATIRSRRGKQVPHTLGVLDFLVALQRELLGRSGFRLDLWLAEPDARHEYRVARADRVSRRIFRPDAYFRIELSDGSLQSFFLEYDRANASAQKWACSVQSHLAYRKSGLFVKRYGDSNGELFRTLVVTTGGERRLNRLRTVALDLGATFYLFTTEAAVAGQGLLSPLWKSASGADGQSILEGVPFCRERLGM